VARELGKFGSAIPVYANHFTQTIMQAGNIHELFGRDREYWMMHNWLSSDVGQLVEHMYVALEKVDTLFKKTDLLDPSLFCQNSQDH
jgi:hypothetical protein